MTVNKSATQAKRPFARASATVSQDGLRGAAAPAGEDTLYGVVWSTSPECDVAIDGPEGALVAYADRDTAEAMGRATEFLLQLHDPRNRKRHTVAEVTVR